MTTTDKDSGWVIHELYAMREAGKINDVEARWILQCIYGEAGLQQLLRDLQAVSKTS